MLVTAHRVNDSRFAPRLANFAAVISTAIVLNVDRAAMFCFSSQIRATISGSGHLSFPPIVF
jgi:hypothetical protein